MANDDIKDWLRYDAETGVFTWAKSPSSRRMAGDTAGYVDRKGYRTIRFQNRLYLACHLAWLFARGEMPPSVIDHKNLNPSDDRIENLRLATQSQNIAHALIRKNNTSGFKGVCRSRNRWIAYVAPNRRHVRLGSFKNTEDAARAHDAAAIKYFGAFARLNFPRPE